MMPEHAMQLTEPYPAPVARCVDLVRTCCNALTPHRDYRLVAHWGEASVVIDLYCGHKSWPDIRGPHYAHLDALTVLVEVAGQDIAAYVDVHKPPMGLGALRRRIR